MRPYVRLRGWAWGVHVACNTSKHSTAADMLQVIFILNNAGKLPYLFDKEKEA